MRLTQLAISQFKSINSLHIKNFHTFDIFIGKNNSGKSNILDAAMLFLHQEKYPEQLFDVHDARINAHFSLNAEDAKDFRFSGTNTELRCELHPGQIKKFFVGDTEISAQETRNFLQKHTVHINTTRILVEYQREISTQIRVGDISTSFADTAFQELRDQYPKQYAQFLSSLKFMFPHLNFQPDKDLFIKMRSLKHLSEVNVAPHIMEGDAMRSIANLGSGYLQLFVMLLFIHHPRYSLVIIDEPENHLHIGLQKKLFKLMLGASKQKQIIISTHSPLFVTPESFVSLHRVVKNDDLNTYIFPSDQSQPYINIQRLSQELNLESNEMLFSDHVVLVEGEADEILVGGMVDRFYKGDKEIMVFAVHSNTNFKIYRDMLQFFQIPFSILTDKDSLFSNIDIIEEIFRHNSHINPQQKINILKKHGIYVLPFGALEKHYPRKYQNRESTKPLNALNAAKHITVEEFQSFRMQPIAELIQNI